MKNYCRYCGYCVDPGVRDYYCTAHEKFLSSETIKSRTRCKDYGYCGVDVITGKDHKMRRHLHRRAQADVDIRQIRFRDWIAEMEARGEQ